MLVFFGHGLFLDQKVFRPNFFSTKTTTTITTTTTTTLMGSDTIEINLKSKLEIQIKKGNSKS